MLFVPVFIISFLITCPGMLYAEELPLVETSQQEPVVTEEAPVAEEIVIPPEAGDAKDLVKEVTEEVVLEKPVVEKPVVEKPVVEKPVLEKLVVEEPMIKVEERKQATQEPKKQAVVYKTPKGGLPHP